jgi:hypothetical protein
MAMAVIVFVVRCRTGLGDDLDAPVSNPASGEDSIRDRLEVVRPASHHDDLEAQIVAQVNV